MGRDEVHHRDQDNHPVGVVNHKVASRCMMTLYRMGFRPTKEVRRVNVAMHINHRRKNKWRPKHHGRRSYAWHMIYSMKMMRRESWQQRRAQARHLMVHDRFDVLPQAYRKDIYWNYW